METRKNEPLATELIGDCTKELQEQLESLDTFENEIIEVQKKITDLHRLIRIQRIHIKGFLAVSYTHLDVYKRQGLSTLLSFEYETVLLSKNMAISIMMSLFLAIFTVLH